MLNKCLLPRNKYLTCRNLCNLWFAHWQFRTTNKQLGSNHSHAATYTMQGAGLRTSNFYLCCGHKVWHVLYYNIPSLVVNKLTNYKPITTWAAGKRLYKRRCRM